MNWWMAVLFSVGDVASEKWFMFISFFNHLHFHDQIRIKIVCSIPHMFPFLVIEIGQSEVNTSTYSGSQTATSWCFFLHKMQFIALSKRFPMSSIFESLNFLTFSIALTYMYIHTYIHMICPFFSNKKKHLPIPNTGHAENDANGR